MHELAGDTVGTLCACGPLVFVYFILFRKFILWFFAFSVPLKCQCSTLLLFIHLAIDSFLTPAYSFCMLIALAALCL